MKKFSILKTILYVLLAWCVYKTYSCISYLNTPEGFTSFKQGYMEKSAKFNNFVNESKKYDVDEKYLINCEKAIQERLQYPNTYKRTDYINKIEKDDIYVLIKFKYNNGYTIIDEVGKCVFSNKYSHDTNDLILNFISIGNHKEFYKSDIKRFITVK